MSAEPIPFEIVRQYADANIAVVPLYPNGDPDVTNIFTKQELETLPLELPDNLRKMVYKNDAKEIKPLKLLALQPQSARDFWTDERIARQTWSGIACQTGFIASISAVIAAVDADDLKTRTILEKRIAEYSLLDKTIVQETPHKGKHLIFKIPVDADKLEEQIEFWGKRSLQPSMCKNDCVMEIKMRTMQITLDPTRHRNERHLTYTRTGNVIAIAELPWLYDLLIGDLKSYDCLESTPDEYNKKREEQAQNDFNGNKSFDPNAERFDLTPKEMTDCIDIILGRDESNQKENSPFGSIYVPHHRNEVAMSLSGFFYYSHITLTDAEQVIRKLAEEANKDGTANVGKAIANVATAYRRGDDGLPVRGKSGLVEAFTRAHRDKNETLAKNRFSKLREVIKVDYKKPKSKGGQNKIGFGKFGQLTESDLIANLAREKILFMFKNHYNKPYAVVKVQNHYETLDMISKESSFLGALRQMWMDENLANGNAQKSTIAENQLVNAQKSLIADVNQPECRPIETHLRVAWKSLDNTIRYDLANTLNQQVEVIGSNDGVSGVKIINSDAILDEIKDYKDSQFAKNKLPMFFHRYLNVKEQVLPSLPDTLDKANIILNAFYEDLTNITDSRARPDAKRFAQHWKTEGSFDNRTKILLAKVSLISKLIPDIPHFIETVFGAPGAMKSHYLTFEKRLIDPGITELHNPNISKKDIQLKFAQNYFVVFDNVGEIDKWLSDLICAVITKTGWESRELFTNLGIVSLELNSCVSVGGVSRLFTEEDALRRSLNIELLQIDKSDKRYIPKVKAESNFEALRPLLFGAMLAILSKAIDLKQEISGKYNLGSMADVLEWGESLSQAMGYEPMELLNAYNRLDIIQRKHASKYDPLIVIYIKLFYKIFENPEEASFYTEQRKQRYTTFTYADLSKRLDDLAEADGYAIGKENKLWPKESQQLARRSREISSRLLDTDGIAIEIRQNSSSRSNEFIIGYKDGVDKYVTETEQEYQKETEAERQRREIEELNHNMAYIQYVAHLQACYPQSRSIKQIGEFVAAHDELVDKYLDGKFTQDDNRKVRKLYDKLLEDSRIEKIGERYLIFKWVSEHETSNGTDNGTDSSTLNEKGSVTPKPPFEPQLVKGVSLEEINDELRLTACTRRDFSFPKITDEIFSYNSSSNLKQEKVVISGASLVTPQFTPSETVENHPKSESATKIAAFQPVPIPSLLLEQVPEFAKLASFDCEWYREDLKENKDKNRAGDIYAFCLTDSQGNNVQLHIDQFDGDRPAFMSAILDVLDRYDALAGFAIFSDRDFISDIDHIGMNCEKVNLLQRFAGIKTRVKFLDVKKIFSNNTVKGFLRAADKVAYREESLGAVAKAYIGEGKPEGVSGVNAEFLPLGEELNYCLQDAQLCYKILQKKDFELLQILYEIGQEIKLSFFETCNAGYPTEWWRSKLASIGYQKVSSSVQTWIDQNMTYNDKKKPNKKTGVKYLGGHVISPTMGRHLNAVSYDVSSMYPTMANIHNISTETINCSCCAGVASAKVPDEVMADINAYLLEDDSKARNKSPRPWHYWLCQKKRGQFAEVMKDLVERKIQYKTQGLKLKEKSVKILANSGYGCFGNGYFHFQDPRLAELITSFGQYTIKSLAKFVGKDKVLYGDTDSIYLVGANENIIAEAKDKFGVRLEVDNAWKILFLTNNKKQYVGLTEDGELVHTTLTGMKSNQPSYYNEVAQKLINREFLEPFIDTSADIALERIIKYLGSSFIDLGLSDTLDKLSFSFEAKEPLYAHKNNNIQRQIYNEILEDCNNDVDIAKSKSQAGRVYRYWKVKEKKRSATIHPERYQLNMMKYREGLFNCIKPELEVYGMNENDISQLHKELFESQNML